MDDLGRWWWAAGAALVVCVTVALRVAGPADVHDKDQPAVMGHALDVAAGGAWLLQAEPETGYATKPPMLPWLSGAGIAVTGWTGVGAFKWPSLLGLALACAATWRLGWRVAGPACGAVAVVVLVANPQTWKLLWLARTDMLLTGLLAIALVAVVEQAWAWRRPGMEPTRRNPAWIALFWVVVAAALLTKGPPAGVAVLWLVGAIALTGGLRRCGIVWQVLGLVFAAGVYVSWFGLALRAHPDWWDATLQAEMAQRIARTGPYAERGWEGWKYPLYLVRGMLPWSIAGVGGLVLAGLAWREDLWRRSAWTVGAIASVIALLLVAAGSRADRLEPAYPAAAVLVAAVVIDAGRRPGWHRAVVHLLLGGVAGAGVGSLAGWALLERPATDVMVIGELPAPPGETLLLAVCILATLAGLATLWLCHRRRYPLAAVTAGVCVIAWLGLVQLRLDDWGMRRHGDALLAVIDTARSLPGPVAACRVGYAPVQPLLGLHEPVDERALAKVERGGMLITDAAAWATIADRFAGRSRLVMHTRPLDGSGIALVVVQVQTP